MYNSAPRLFLDAGQFFRLRTAAPIPPRLHSPLMPVDGGPPRNHSPVLSVLIHRHRSVPASSRRLPFPCRPPIPHRDSPLNAENRALHRRRARFWANWKLCWNRQSGYPKPAHRNFHQRRENSQQETQNCLCNEIRHRRPNNFIHFNITSCTGNI